MNYNIKDILASMSNIDGWQVKEERTRASELFFIKRDVDMNRSKDVHHIYVTVYKSFEEDGKKYMGSSKTTLAPTMTNEEVVQILDDAAYASSFVKNEYYPIVKPTNESKVQLTSSMDQKPIEQWLPEMTQCVYECHELVDQALNSAELFVDEINTRLFNSEGVDEQYKHYKIFLEFITNWKGEKEEVELYKSIKCSDYSPELIKTAVKDMIDLAVEKSKAEPMRTLKEMSVLLTGGAVRQFMLYYADKSNSKMIYEKVSDFEIGKSVQGNEIKGDRLSLMLDPALPNSTFAAPVDEDGVVLRKTDVIKDGILNQYWGGHRYAHYLDIEATGLNRNFVVESGSKTIEEMKADSYIELVEFSDFYVDSITGDFAGEIRLAHYYDGNSVKPFTLGAISGNIKDVQEEMYFSKEKQQINNYHGPKMLQFFNGSITGN